MKRKTDMNNTREAEGQEAKAMQYLQELPIGH